MKLYIRQLPAVIILLLACSCSEKQPPPITGILTHPGQGYEDHEIDLAKPDVVKRKGQYELRVYYIAKGTRSEGLHGVLIVNGSVVDDAVADKEMKADVGLLHCHGPWQKRKLLFVSSGWLPMDTSTISPSWQKKRNGKAEQCN